MTHNVHRKQVGRGRCIAENRIKASHLTGSPRKQHLAPRLEQTTNFTIHKPDIRLNILGTAQFC